MKYANTFRAGRVMPFLLLALLGFAVQLVQPDSAMAQSEESSETPRYSLDFSGKPLPEVLEILATTTQANLMFDPELVGQQYVYRRLRGNSIQQLLNALLADTELDFITLSSGTLVIVRATARAAVYGSLTGKVVDAETGAPLPGANVTLADASGGTYTNQAGQFSFNQLLSGRHELIFSYVGYEPVRIEIMISKDGQQHEHIALPPRAFSIQPVVVPAHRSRYAEMRHAQHHQHQEWEQAGEKRSAMQSLSLFSGVQHGLPLTDTHIQGGQRGEHRLYLDGIPVYNPYSFGQLFSAFSPYAVGQMQIEKAGFDASEGSHITGKIDVQHRNTPRRNESLLVQADAFNTNVFAGQEFSLQNGQAVELMAAFRSSLWETYEAPGLRNTLQSWDQVDPLLYDLLQQRESKTGMRDFRPVNNRSDLSFYDAHVSAAWEPGPYQRVQASFYRGGNDVQTDVLTQEQLYSDAQYMFARDSYNWTNTAAQLRYNWIASPRLDLSGQIGYSHNEMQHGYAMADNDLIHRLSNEAVFYYEQPSDPDAITLRNKHDDTEGLSEESLFERVARNLDEAAWQLDNNMMQHLLARVDATYAFNPDVELEAGVQTDILRSRFDLSGLFYLPAVDDQESEIYSSYVNLKWRLSPPLLLTAGSRLSYFLGSRQQQMYAEPRLRLQYDRRDSGIGPWSLRLSGGIYRQFVNQFDVTNAGPSSIVPAFSIWAHDSGLQQPLAYHTALSFLAEPSLLGHIHAEGWLRFQPAAYITSYDRLLYNSGDTREGFDAFAEVTDMRAAGGSLRITRELLQKRLQLLAGYDYSYARIDMESQFGREMPAAWNQPHTLQARAMSPLGTRWTLVAKWQRVMGRKWAFRQSYYDFLMLHSVEGIGQFDFTSPENDGLPAFDQLDLSVVYARSVGATRLQARLDLNNLLNRRNVVDYSVIPVATQDDGSQVLDVRARKLPGFTPSVSLQLSF